MTIRKGLKWKRVETYEGVAAACHTFHLLHPLLALLLAEQLWYLLEDGLEHFPLHPFFRHLPCYEQINSITLIGPLGPFLPFQVQHSRMVSHPPRIRLVTREPRAVNA